MPESVSMIIEPPEFNSSGSIPIEPALEDLLNPFKKLKQPQTEIILSKALVSLAVMHNITRPTEFRKSRISNKVLEYLDKEGLTLEFIRFHEKLTNYLEDKIKDIDYMIDIELESDPEATNWYDIVFIIEVKCDSYEELLALWRQLIGDIYRTLKKESPKLSKMTEIIFEKYER